VELSERNLKLLTTEAQDTVERKPTTVFCTRHLQPTICGKLGKTAANAKQLEFLNGKIKEFLEVKRFLAFQILP